VDRDDIVTGSGLLSRRPGAKKTKADAIAGSFGGADENASTIALRATTLKPQSTTDH
jgi:hypothetical protein